MCIRFSSISDVLRAVQNPDCFVVVAAADSYQSPSAFFILYFPSYLKDGGQGRPDTGRIWSILAGHRGPLDGAPFMDPRSSGLISLIAIGCDYVELISIYVMRHHSNQACVARHSGEIAADAYVTGVQHKSTLPSGETKLKLVLCSGMRCDM